MFYYLRFTIYYVLFTVFLQSLFFGAGTTAVNFLRIGVGARVVGMGEAYTAVSDEANAIYWNPGGLSQLHSEEVSFMRAMWIETINYDHLVYILPIKLGDEKHILGASIDYVSMSPIQKVGIKKDDLANPDPDDSITETYSPNDLALTLSWSKKFVNKICTGASIKFIQSKIERESAYAFGIDLGGLYILNDNISFGAVLKNIGTPIKFREKSYNLPMDIKLGVALRLLENKLITAVDIVMPADNNVYFNVGAEYKLLSKKEISLCPRVGYKGTGNLSCGVGIIGYGVVFDYAWMPFSGIGNTHRMSISFPFAVKK
ncbi:MAG: PorV/PorQ family protein [Elusimicrobiota bacterium]